MRLSRRAFGLALGVLMGLGFFLGTLYASVFETWPYFHLFATFLPFLQRTPIGAFYGLFGGFIEGYVIGWFFAWMYNWFYRILYRS